MFLSTLELDPLHVISPTTLILFYLILKFDSCIFLKHTINFILSLFLTPRSIVSGSNSLHLFCLTGLGLSLKLHTLRMVSCLSNTIRESPEWAGRSIS